MLFLGIWILAGRVAFFHRFEGRPFGGAMMGQRRLFLMSAPRLRAFLSKTQIDVAAQNRRFRQFVDSRQILYTIGFNIHTLRTHIGFKCTQNLRIYHKRSAVNER